MMPSDYLIRVAQAEQARVDSERQPEPDVLFSDDPEVNRLCVQRADIVEFISTNQLSDKAYDDLCEQLAEIEVKLQELGE